MEARQIAGARAGAAPATTADRDATRLRRGGGDRRPETEPHAAAPAGEIPGRADPRARAIATSSATDTGTGTGSAAEPAAGAGAATPAATVSTAVTVRVADSIVVTVRAVVDTPATATMVRAAAGTGATAKTDVGVPVGIARSGMVASATILRSAMALRVGIGRSVGVLRGRAAARVRMGRARAVRGTRAGSRAPAAYVEGGGLTELPWTPEYAEIFGDRATLVAALRHRWQQTRRAQLDSHLPEHVLEEQWCRLHTRHAGVLQLLEQVDGERVPLAG